MSINMKLISNQNKPYLKNKLYVPVEPGEFNVSTNPTAVVFPNSPFDINENGKLDFKNY